MTMTTRVPSRVCAWARPSLHEVAGLGVWGANGPK
jgi:hypothetical protein